MKDLQKADDEVSKVTPGSQEVEYVIDKIVDQGYRNGKLFLKGEWYGYEEEYAKWEPIAELPRSAAVAYLRRKQLALPLQTSQAKVGWAPR